ncbi:type II secretion system protein N [Henriciella aquimarina]|uniref:type II secretion system protein N n=1 Tax=Henriciella aquimarina TaxID=545261 RepID=UPI000A05A33B|nr:type II secretion system protein N [Henriciella aquimarina]
MMRFVLILIAVLALAGFALSQVPLGFALSRLPLNAMGVQWTQSEGTVWDGRVMGVYFRNQPVGDVDVALAPMSLLSFKPALDVQWGGAGGRGAATLVLAGESTYRAEDVRLEQKVSALESLSPDLRAIRGTFRLSGGSARIDDFRCTSASGEIRSDTLSLAARQFGRSFSDLTGTLACEDGAFRFVMQGAGPDGDTVSVNGRAHLQGEAEISVEADTSDSDIETLLANAGFAREDGRWSYERSSSQTAGAGAP